MKTMTIDEFKEYCSKQDYNIVREYKYDRFPITCGKCKSKNVRVMFNPERGAEGSEYTGYMHGFYNNAQLVVKCLNCGNAMIVEVDDS